MEKTWAFETHGDPLGALHAVVEHVWQEARLDGLFVAADPSDQAANEAHILTQPGQFNQVNPFEPSMRSNTARLVPGVLAERPEARLGAVLRPCEMRAVAEMERTGVFPAERLLTISVDCLGTYPVEDLEWREARKHSSGELADETLQFARQGGIAAYRYRPACQVCPSPKADLADVNIGVMGLPARQHILVSVRDDAVADRLNFKNLPLLPASPDSIQKRERVFARLGVRNSLTRDRIVGGVAKLIPADLESWVRQLDECGDCKMCLDACPIASQRPLVRAAGGRYDRHEIAHWLVACTGCGMCEQACQKNLPLSAIFGLIREQLRGLPEFSSEYPASKFVL